MAIVYLSLGSNIGERMQHLGQACRLLHQHPAMTVQAVSSLYRTAPIGVTAQDWFVNAVVSVQTTLRPPSLLCVTQAIERRLGRVTTLRWGPRILDIDILLYDTLQLYTPSLTIPHAALSERRFVLVPLAELVPDMQTPSGVRVRDLLAALPDANDVQLAGLLPTFANG
jgi:2-amino-4-hydroxy-6-hydroxymethyldihydropteridine diphosphokinase